MKWFLETSDDNIETLYKRQLNCLEVTTEETFREGFLSLFSTLQWAYAENFVSFYTVTQKVPTYVHTSSMEEIYFGDEEEIGRH